MIHSLKRWILVMIAAIIFMTTINVGVADISVSGTMTGEIWPEDPTDDLEPVPFKNMTVILRGVDELDNFILDNNLATNDQGFYNTGLINTIRYPELNPESKVYLFAILAGPHVRIFNDMVTPNQRYQSDYFDLDPSTLFTADHNWGSGSEQNAYYHTTLIHEYFTGRPYPFDFNAMNFQVQVHVEANAGGQCGLTTDTIRLDPGACSQTSDILYHEYTHLVITNIYNGTLLASDLVQRSFAEGIADYFAVSINDGDSQFGEEGIAGVPHRDLNNEVTMLNWIDDDGDGHIEEEAYLNSRILSGALWDIRQELGQSTTDRLIFRALREFQPISFEQMHYYMLLVDDDNANIHDGTPNGEIIFNAFNETHGMNFISYSPQEPWFFEQYNSDGVTEIPFGGTTNERNVVLKASVNSLGVGSRSTLGVIDPDLQLEVEVKTIGTPFDGSPNCTSGPAVVRGNTAIVTCPDFPAGQYHWQARVKNVYGVVGVWASAGENSENDPDFEIISTPPNQPTSLTQFGSDGITGIPLGEITTESIVVMKGGVSDPDNDNVQLEVEVRPLGTAFTDTPTCISGAAVASGSTASATCLGLTNGQYHWQARAKDSNDAIGPWVSAGGNPENETDFEVRVNGRTGGPDHFGYTFKDSNVQGGPAYEWIEITQTGQKIIPNCDDCFVDDIPVGFFFNFYGIDYSQLSITNNGLTLASGGTSQYTNQPIGSSTPHNFIAPFWDDIVTWDSLRADAIYYQTIGEAPNRKFVVQWNDNYHYSSSPSGITFEAILYEGSNNIKFQYKDVNFGVNSWDNGASATVGIEGADGRGLQYSYNERVIDPGLAILFKYPQFTGTNLYLSKHAPASKDHGSTMTYTLYYHNFGDTAAQNVILDDTLPAGIEFISASDGGSYNPNTRKVTWNIGTLLPLGHNYRTVSVRINDGVAVGTVIQNNARIDTSTLEVRYDDNDASAQTRVTGSTLPPDVGVEPNNGGPGAPSVRWNTPITFSYYSECATNIEISIQHRSGSVITGSMTGGPDWSYTTSFSTPGEATITYTITGCAQSIVSFNIYIDPAGYIFDMNTGDRIEGATVWLQWPDGEGGWVPVPVIEPAYMIPNSNPLISNETGWYQWDVVEGSYRVHVEAAGYYPADSIVVSVPPAVFDLHVGLTRISGPNEPPVAADDSVTTDEDTSVTFDVTTNDNDPDGNLDTSSTATLSNPSHGSVVNNGNGMFAYTPNTDYNGADSFTYRICDTNGLCDTATVTITVNPVNDPPVASVDRTEQTVQYSDGISTVTISASDVDSFLTLITSWKMNDGAEQTGLPNDLSLSSGSCTTTGPSTACTWTLGGKANVTAGNYNISFNVSDGQYERIKHTNLTVISEDSMIAFDDSNPVAVKVAAPGGKSGVFYLKVNVKESVPDLSAILPPFPGDINLAEVSVSLVPVGPGSSVSPTPPCSRTVNGIGYDATLTFDCGFNSVEVNTYEVMVSVNGGYYIGSGENVLVVYDPSLGFTTGGGTFPWPETGEKTNFGYNMNYNKKGTNVRGNFVLVRHLSDGTIYRVKSNALYGLSLGEFTNAGWSSFSGKATYLEPGWTDPKGNHEFIVYVEDRNEFGSGVDRFWIKVKGQDGKTIAAMSLNDPSANNAIALSGGNIVVPHK